MENNVIEAQLKYVLFMYKLFVSLSTKTTLDLSLYEIEKKINSQSLTDVYKRSFNLCAFLTRSSTLLVLGVNVVASSLRAKFTSGYKR